MSKMFSLVSAKGTMTEIPETPKLPVGTELLQADRRAAVLKVNDDGTFYAITFGSLPDVRKISKADYVRPLSEKFGIGTYYYDDMRKVPQAEIDEAYARYQTQEAVRVSEASRPAPAPAPSTGHGATVKYNREKDGLEISFPKKPSDEVLATLKLGRVFRWSKYNAVWWAKNTAAARAIAERVGVLPADLPTGNSSGDDFDNMIADQNWDAIK